MRSSRGICHPVINMMFPVCSIVSAVNFVFKTTCVNINTD